MHFSGAFLLAIAGLAAAQSSTSAAVPATSSSASTSGCGSAIDQIIAACLQSQEPLLKQCAVQDWKCLCEQSNNVLTCYNNCPSDPDAFGIQQQTNSYCNAADTVPDASSSTAAATGRPTAGGASSAPAASSGATQTQNPVHTGFASGSASASASASATGQGAANGLVPAGGLLAAAFGLALL